MKNSGKLSDDVVKNTKNTDESKREEFSKKFSQMLKTFHDSMH